MPKVISSRDWPPDQPSLLRIIAQESDELIVALDTDFRVLASNEAFNRHLRRLTGRDPVIGESLLDQLGTLPQRHRAESLWRRALTGESFTYTVTLDGPEGKPITLAIDFRPLLSETDEVLGAYHMARDISDRLAVQSEIGRLASRLEAQEVRALLAAIVESSGDAILSKSLDGTITSWNRGAEELYGYSREEAVGRPVSMLIPEGRPDELPAIMERIRSGKRVEHYETERIAKDGRVIPISLTVSPVVDDGGEIIGASAIARDITFRKRMDAERDAMLAELRRASQAKTDFMASMSHELRTPLNAIIGYTDLLEAGVPEQIPREAGVQVDRIRRSARHLLRLIEEILSFSRAERHGVDLGIARAELREQLDQVRAIIQPLARERGLDFRMAVEDGVPDEIRTDPGKLRQILVNLLGNAVKFTERGRVDLSVRQEAESLVYEVSDTGRGIDPADVDHLFEPFWQSDQSLTRSQGGSGLGLTVALRYARALGGGIEVDSEQGRGTTFRVTLPLEPPARGAGRDKEAERRAG